MAVGLVRCLEKSCAKAQNWSVEAPLKSAGTSTRSHWDHLKHCLLLSLYPFCHGIQWCCYLYHMHP